MGILFDKNLYRLRRQLQLKLSKLEFNLDVADAISVLVKCSKLTASQIPQNRGIQEGIYTWIEQVNFPQPCGYRDIHEVQSADTNSLKVDLQTG